MPATHELVVRGITFDPLIPVFDRFAKAFPLHAEGEPATYGNYSEACTTAFGFDAHFSAYSLPAIERRLGTQAALTYGPKMVLFVMDVDGPGHARTPQWDVEIQTKIRALFKAKGGGYAFSTKGGARICYGLKEELVLRTAADAMRWRVSYGDWIAMIQREFRIICDDKCGDWPRLFRLPRVTRDGVAVQPDFEIGEPDRMTAWREAYVPFDDPRCVRVDTGPAEIAEPAPVTEDKLEEAARALAAMWPRRGRHYASLALCGALARAGWSDEAIADFVAAVCEIAEPGCGLYEKRLTQARASAEKVARGEDVSGWPTLVQHMTTGIDGQLDASRLERVEAAVLAARRPLGQGPPIELFEQARSAQPAPMTTVSNATGALKLLNASLDGAGTVIIPHEPVDGPTRAEQLDAACAEMNGDAAYRELLDDAATRLEPLIAAAEAKATAVDARPMGMSYRTIRARNAPAPDYLVQYLITREGVGALSGEPKSGKSWDATHIAVAVADGTKPVFGKYAVNAPAGVFYFYAEDTESSINNRISAIAAGMGLDPQGAWVDRLVAQPRGRPLDIMSLADLCVLVASVRRFEKLTAQKFRLVVLDPLSNIHSGEEDKRDSMVKVMARLHAVEQILGCAILFVHHSGKSSAENKGRKRGGQKMRGSSVVHGAVDFGIYVSDVRGDGKCEFLGRIESEVKAARAGGIFDRTISITDNEQGNATRVVFAWAEPKDDKTGPKDLTEERAVQIVYALFKQGAPMSRDDLLKKIKGGVRELQAAVDIALDEKWIAQRFHGQRAAGYEITAKGKEIVRSGPPGDSEGSGEDGSGPATPPKTDIGGFLALPPPGMS